MKAFFAMMRTFPAYLWSGWSAIAVLFLCIALWELGHTLYGTLALPSPKATFLLLKEVAFNEEWHEAFFITLYRGMVGFGIAMGFGIGLGVLAGAFVTASFMSRPVMSLLIGMPPIAWIVLAMLWFGTGDMPVIFTVVVAAFPLVFIGALQGMRTLEGDLKTMCESFRVPLLMRIWVLYIPHLFSYLFPASITALGMSWKIVIMAELLSSHNGLGAMLAVSRAQLDTEGAFGIIVLLIGALMVVEYLLLEPIKREVEAWRT